MHVAWWEGCTLKIFFEDRRGDDFQLWFSPCSPAMCGGRVRKEHKSAMLQNAAYFQNVPPFITGRKTPPISHPNEAAEKKLNNPELFLSNHHLGYTAGDRKTQSRPAETRCHSTPFNSARCPPRPSLNRTRRKLNKVQVWLACARLVPFAPPYCTLLFSLVP